MRTLRSLFALAPLLASACLCVGEVNVGGHLGGKDGGADGGLIDGGTGGGATGGGTGGATGGGSGGGTGGSVTGGGTGGAGGGSGGGTGGVAYDGGCGPIQVGNPPYAKKCAAPTNNECDGTTDTALTGLGVTSARLNGGMGNGFDDDCDGEVDEGCSCPGNGQTKPCYLVPATMASPSSGEPVGWCTNNSKGSLDCQGGELSSWSGTCRGAQPPYAHDTCSSGDFNCDGLNGNPDNTGCNCPDAVKCPTTTITLSPFPSPTAIPLIDGSQWVTDSTQRTQTTNWKWTALGGDCDNVLPNPTFALYAQADSTVAGAKRGGRVTVKYEASATPPRYVPVTGEPLAAIYAQSYGNGVAGGQVHTAFALSGDYIVQGEFDLNGHHYACTQKVAVRAPGVRAELCWDTVGGDGTSDGNDLDLHFARLQGVTSSTQGWDSVSGVKQDCYWNPSSGCREGSSSAPGWGYADSSNSACQGWGSNRATGGTLGCTNPRLDRDNITCDPATTDPASGSSGTFCGPENINLDNPKDNDTFVIGVNHYLNHGGTSNAKPHVNIYCNGERVTSVGFNPATGVQWPLLTQYGYDSSGDWWTVATVKAHVAGGTLNGCDVVTVPSHHADPGRDGPVATAGAGNDLCVDSTANASPAPNQSSYTSHKFIDFAAVQGGATGTVPSSAAGWCKH